MVVNIVDVGWATSKSGCLPITDRNNAFDPKRILFLKTDKMAIDNGETQGDISSVELSLEGHKWSTKIYFFTGIQVFPFISEKKVSLLHSSESLAPDTVHTFYQCCGSGSESGSGSTGSTCFWASRIRIRIH
jgi:hypothetical protein